MQNPSFIVHCERVRKTKWYYVKFPINDQLVNRVKALPHETRKWNAKMICWEISTESLYALIKSYRKSNKIHFDFGNEDSRKIFIGQIERLELAEIEKRKFIAELNVKKEQWVEYKKKLEDDYEKYSEKLHALLKEDVKLYPHQIVAAMFMNVTRSTLISHEMGLGKAEPLDNKLVTPNGLIRMGDIRIDDNVIGSDGKPKKVLGVYPQGLKDIYEITFNDGTTARSCDEHLWNVNTYIRNWRGNPFMTKSLRNIMDDGLQFKNGNNRWYIPIVKPIDFVKRELKINPYVLGCLLGDGSITTKNSVGFSSVDDGIINEVQNRLPDKHNLVINGQSLKDYYLTADGKNNLINQGLKYYGLKGRNSHTKFVPEDYKFSSIEQRIEILQGILDTDGHSRKDGIVELTLASKELIQDVQFIVQSLGGIGRLHEKWVTYEGERRLYWRLHIKLPPQFTPFKLDRKIKTFVAPTKYKPNRAIVSVKYIGKQEAQCIMVDSEDHLYLTDNCVVTHNTLSSILYVEMNGFDKVVVVTPNSLKFNYYGEVKKFTNSTAHIVNWKKNTCGIEEAKYVIVNYDFFNPNTKSGKFLTKWKKLGIDKIDCVVADECFPYNTKILTNVGELKIGDIVENALDIKIITYNHKLKKTEPKSISRYLYNGRKKTIKVRFSNGVIIECTPDHKFYSIDDDKYKSIESFKIGEKLYEYKTEKSEDSNRSEDMSTMQTKFQTKEKFTNILFKKMFIKFYFERKCPKGVDNQRKKWKFITKYNKDMSDLSERIPVKKTLWSEILFNKLFCKMENESTRNKEMCIYKRECRENFGGIVKKLQGETRTKNSIIETNETKQSDVQSRILRENEKKIYWKNIFIKRWKRAIDKTTNNIISSNFRDNQNGNGMCDTNIETIKENECGSKIPTDTLQSGYWNTRNKISNRDRRKFTQNKEVEILRQKENGNIGIVWVENIEILESGDRPEFRGGDNKNKRVYDLEVEDNHNFFANGILVSNCQKLKNTKSNTYKNFDTTFKKKIFKGDRVSKIFLSGTPAPNRAYELYTVLHQISPLDFETKTYFQEYYCGMTYDADAGWGYHTNTAEQKLEELYHKIAPFTHRKRKIDALKDLPDKTYQRIILEMTDDEQRIYEEIEAGVANEFVEHPNGNPLTIMIRLRQYLAQIKVKHIIKLIDNVFDVGEKVVVVDYFKDSLYELHEKLGDVAALHTGDQDVEERSDIVKKFQDSTSEIRAFLGSIQTCNYGLTLTAASKLFIVTLPYSVGEYDQVSDRLHRIGQKSAVNIYVLVFPDTIDDYVFSAIESKRREIVKVIDNEDYESDVSESVLSEVIDRIKKKHKKNVDENEQ